MQICVCRIIPDAIVLLMQTSSNCLSSEIIVLIIQLTLMNTIIALSNAAKLCACKHHMQLLNISRIHVQCIVQTTQHMLL